MKLLLAALPLVALAPPASAQAIDRSTWVVNSLYAQHIVDTIDIEGDLMVAAHTESGGFGRGMTIYERNAATGAWDLVQSMSLQLIGSTFHSVHFDQGRIYVGNPQFQMPAIDIYSRDVSGQFVREDTIMGQGGFGTGWVVHADGDLMFALGSSVVEVHERDASGVMNLVQVLTLGTGTTSLGSSVMHTDGDWLFVSQRSLRELIVLRRDPTSGLYAEHSRHPFVGADFYSNRQNMAGSGGRLLFSSSGEGAVNEYRYDAGSDTWDLVHIVRATIPAQFGTEFGSSISLEGDRMVVGAPRSGRIGLNLGDVYVFDFDATTDTWNESLILRSRDFPHVYRGCTAVGIDQGQIAVATPDFGDNQRNVELTIFDTASDPNNTLVADATEVGTTYCDPAVINFSYVPGRLAAYQPNGPSTTSMELIAQHLPRNTFGYAIASSAAAFIPTPGGSRGNLCLAPGPDLGRYVNSVTNSGEAGWFTTTIDLTAIPVAAGAPRMLASGDVWCFQLWYRDGPTSNFTNAVQVTVP